MCSQGLGGSDLGRGAIGVAQIQAGLGDHGIQEPILHRFLGAHEKVAVGVHRHLLHGLARELRQVPVQRQLVVQDLVGLDLNVCEHMESSWMLLDASVAAAANAGSDVSSNQP